MAKAFIKCIAFKLKFVGRLGSGFLKKYITSKFIKKNPVPNKRNGTLYNMLIYNIVYCILASTRRFSIRPASVALDATGRLSPNALVEILLAATPELTR